MVLADTLALASREKPRFVLDFATLTGACVNALTERYAARSPTAPACTTGCSRRAAAAASASGASRWTRTSTRDLESHGRRRHAVHARQQGRPHPGRALPQPLRRRRRALGARRPRRRPSARADSRTCPPRSPASACATRVHLLGDASRTRQQLQALREHDRDTLTLRRPDDWHLHVRDGAQLAAVLPFTARQFARALVMPNLQAADDDHGRAGRVPRAHPGGAAGRARASNR